MSKNSLEILFETKVKLKIMKFLFQNSEADFSIKELAFRVQEPYDKVAIELAKFVDMGLIKIKP